MRKQKACIFILISVIVLMMFSSCGSGPKSSDMYEQQPPSVQENQNQPKNDSTGANNTQTSDGEGGKDANSNRVATKSSSRKLIKNVNLEIETKEFDKLTPSLEKQIALLGGYVETSELTGKSYDDNSIRRGSMIARIPNQKLDEFVSSISTLGNILSKNQNTKDVTKDYVNTESHKKALLIEQDRLLALLEKTTDLESIITLEQRLSDVRFQLESYESQLRTYDDLVEYSTVNIKYQEVKEPEKVIKTDKQSTWSKMSNKFLNSLTNVSNGFKSFLISFIGNIPYLILLAILVIIIFFIAKKISKNEKVKQVVKTKNESLKQVVKAKKDEFILKDDNKSEQ